MFKKSFFIVMMLLLSACEHFPKPEELHGARGALTPTEHYVIRAGDTLFGIAWRYGLDMEELARWNGLTNVNRIMAGTVIRLKPPTGVRMVHVKPPEVTAQGQNGWIWPTKGKVIREFDAAKPGHQGLKIAGVRGQPIYAAHQGEVAYVGVGISGYGRMVVLRHENRIFSAYGYLASADVQEGQKIKQGQQIATMGISPQNVAMLHFEIRQHGPSVNPYSFIGTHPRY